MDYPVRTASRAAYRFMRRWPVMNRVTMRQCGRCTAGSRALRRADVTMAESYASKLAALVFG